jgi:hypothetical protein
MLVPVSDFLDYIRDPTFDQVLAKRILAGNQKALERYLNRPVEPMLVREAVMPDAAGYAWARVTPVWTVLSIEYNGSVTNVSQQAVADLPDNTGLKEQFDMGVIGMQPLPSRVYVGMGGVPLSAELQLLLGPPPVTLMTYVGGYFGDMTEDMKLDIIRVSAREVAHNFSEFAGLHDSTYQQADQADPRQKGWTDDELKRYDRARRRTVA